MSDSTVALARRSAACSKVLLVSLVIATNSAMAQGGADRVAGFQLYPGGSSSNVEGAEKVLKDTGYKTVVCRHTADSLAKVVAFYRNDRQLSILGDPGKDDNVTISSKTGAMSILRPWVDMKTLKSNDSTMICISAR